MSIGERISTLRKDKNMTQGQLAKALSVSRQAVSKWESDQSSPDTLNLIRLSDLLETDVEYLATGRETPKPEPPAPPVPEPHHAPPAPVVINLIEKQDKIQERIIEKPVIRKVIRIRYRQNPYILVPLGLICFLAGLLIGHFFL